MNIASLVLGIVSIVLGVFSFGLLSWLGIIFGLIGIVLASVYLAKNKSSNTSLATAGLICSICGTVFSALVFISCVITTPQIYKELIDVIDSFPA